MNRKQRRRQNKMRRQAGGPRPQAIPHLDQAFQHQQAGRLEDAVRAYGLAIEADPDYGPARNNLGVALKDLGRFDDAVQEHTRALRINPADADAHYNLGLVLEAMGEPDKARASYDKALRINPGDAGALNNLGALLVKAGRAEDAVPQLRKALAAGAGHAEVHNNLGAALIELGEAAEAAACLGRALEINPAYDEAHHNLGAALMGQGRTDEAITAFRRALEINPDHANAHNNLGIVLLSLGRADEALDAFRRGHALDPANAAAGHMAAAIGGETTETAPRAFVEKLFDLYARRFDDHLVNDLGYRIPALMLDAVDRWAGAGRTFGQGLDLGCGTGLVAESFGRRVAALEGVDLSPKMVEVAAGKGLYAELHVDDLVDFARRRAAEGRRYDLVVAADTFIYIGDLGPVFAAAGGVLGPGGVFAFSVERRDGDGYTLQTSGRFQHGEDYVRGLGSESGFRLGAAEPVTVRTEHGRPVPGAVFVFAAPA